MSERNPVIPIGGIVISLARAMAETFEGRTDLDRIVASAFGRFSIYGAQVVHFRDRQAWTPYRADAHQREKATQELRSALQAARDAAVEYMAACLARGEHVESITKRLERI